MPRSVLVVLGLVVALTPGSAAAQGETGFEDQTLGGAFASGASIVSNGLEFDVVVFGSFGSPIRVTSGGMAEGSGLELMLPNTIGLDFLLPAGVTEVSLQYGAGCCDSGIVVNGVASPLAAGLSGLDGTTLGGAAVSAIPIGARAIEQGLLTVTGPITSFVLGGTELAIDNVRVTVPEPASAGPAAVALLAALGRRRGQPAT